MNFWLYVVRVRLTGRRQEFEIHKEYFVFEINYTSILYLIHCQKVSFTTLVMGIYVSHGDNWRIHVRFSADASCSTCILLH